MKTRPSFRLGRSPAVSGGKTAENSRDLALDGHGLVGSRERAIAL